jgi:hypothetical protein
LILQKTNHWVLLQRKEKKKLLLSFNLIITNTTKSRFLIEAAFYFKNTYN